MRMKYLRVAALVALVPLIGGATLGSCGLTKGDFVKISEDGFDPDDHAADKNTYAWSSAAFPSDGGGHIYVGTGNNVVPLIGANGPAFTGEAPFTYFLVLPPEIRRYRPDLGPDTWETVLDYRDVEPGTPFWTTVGFRSMTTYEHPDGSEWIYAGTFGQQATLWRSPSGEPGSWDVFWQSEFEGSFRALAVHNGLLYIGSTDEISGDPGPAEIWATDGTDLWQVVSDGFGDPENIGIAAMASFNGYLYAGTGNATGGEIWRLEGPDKQGPALIVDDGGADERNEVFGTAQAFHGELYFGTLIFGGSNPLTGNGPKGADIVVVRADDSWDTVVGPNGLSGYGPGFGKVFNGYLWSLEVHDGWLYAGTSDFSVFLAIILANTEITDISGTIQNILQGLEDFGYPVVNLGGEEKIGTVDLNNRLLGSGADLFKTRDGVNWYPVFRDGLGAPSSGIRTMASYEDSLYLGLAIPFEGLQMWRSEPQRAEE